MERGACEGGGGGVRGETRRDVLLERAKRSEVVDAVVLNFRHQLDAHRSLAHHALQLKLTTTFQVVHLHQTCNHRHAHTINAHQVITHVHP